MPTVYPLLRTGRKSLPNQKESRQEYGNLSATYFYFHAGMQIPAGLLVDRYGPRKVLATGCLPAAIGTVWFAFAGGCLTPAIQARCPGR